MEGRPQQRPDEVVPYKILPFAVRRSEAVARSLLIALLTLRARRTTEAYRSGGLSRSRLARKLSSTALIMPLSSGPKNAAATSYIRSPRPALASGRLHS